MRYKYNSRKVWLISCLIGGSIGISICLALSIGGQSYDSACDNIIPYSELTKQLECIEALEEKTDNAIAEKKIFVGMTKEQVKRSWGKPQKIHGRTITAYSVSEIWTYQIRRGKASADLYFDNNILDTISYD